MECWLISYHHIRSFFLFMVSLYLAVWKNTSILVERTLKYCLVSSIPVFCYIAIKYTKLIWSTQTLVWYSMCHQRRLTKWQVTTTCNKMGKCVVKECDWRSQNYLIYNRNKVIIIAIRVQCYHQNILFSFPR